MSDNKNNNLIEIKGNVEDSNIVSGDNNIFKIIKIYIQQPKTLNTLIILGSITLIAIGLTIILFRYFPIETKQRTESFQIIIITTASGICMGFILILSKAYQNIKALIIILIPLCIAFSIASAAYLLNEPIINIIGRIILPYKNEPKSEEKPEVAPSSRISVGSDNTKEAKSDERVYIPKKSDVKVREEVAEIKPEQELNIINRGSVPQPKPISAIFFDDFNEASISLQNYKPLLPDSIFRRGSDNAKYVGTLNSSFERLGEYSVLRLKNNLSDAQRRGWSTIKNFTVETSTIRIELRFNTMIQSRLTGIDQLIELWILDAHDLNRYDKATVFSWEYGKRRMFVANSTISNYGVEAPFSFKDNTWYRLIITGSAIQSVRASVYEENGANEVSIDLKHTLSSYKNNFKIGISQSMGHPEGNYPTDVAIDWIKLVTAVTL